MQGGGGNKKRFQCTDASGQEILYLRALQGHSGRNPIDPSLQDNVLFPDNFFEYIYHIGCALHSITNSGLILGGQILSRERQTVSSRLWIPWTRNTKIRTSLTWPTHVLYGTSRKRGRHQDTVYYVDVQFAQRKGFKFNQTRCNSIILYDTLPAYCIPKVIVMESGEIIYEKVYASPRLPPKISFKDKWTKELDSAVARTPNESNQNQKPNYQERRDPLVSNSSPRRSRKMSCLVATAPNTQQERWHPWVDNSPQSSRKETLTSESQDF